LNSSTLGQPPAWSMDYEVPQCLCIRGLQPADLEVRPVDEVCDRRQNAKVCIPLIARTGKHKDGVDALRLAGEGNPPTTPGHQHYEFVLPLDQYVWNRQARKHHRAAR